MKFSARWMGVSLLAIPLALTSFGAQAADPIKIGVSGPFTGGSSSMGGLGYERCAPNGSP